MSDKYKFSFEKPDKLFSNNVESSWQIAFSFSIHMFAIRFLQVCRIAGVFQMRLSYFQKQFNSSPEAFFRKKNFLGMRSIMSHNRSEMPWKLCLPLKSTLYLMGCLYSSFYKPPLSCYKEGTNNPFRSLYHVTASSDEPSVWVLWFPQPPCS